MGINHKLREIWQATCEEVSARGVLKSSAPAVAFIFGVASMALGGGLLLNGVREVRANCSDVEGLVTAIIGWGTVYGGSHIAALSLSGGGGEMLGDIARNARKRAATRGVSDRH